MFMALFTLQLTNMRSLKLLWVNKVYIYNCKVENEFNVVELPNFQWKYCADVFHHSDGLYCLALHLRSPSRLWLWFRICRHYCGRCYGKCFIEFYKVLFLIAKTFANSHRYWEISCPPCLRGDFVASGNGLPRQIEKNMRTVSRADSLLM